VKLKTQVREAALGRDHTLYEVVDDVLALTALDVEVDFRAGWPSYTG